MVYAIHILVSKFDMYFHESIRILHMYIPNKITKNVEIFSILTSFVLNILFVFF